MIKWITFSGCCIPYSVNMLISYQIPSIDIWQRFKSNSMKDSHFNYNNWWFIYTPLPHSYFVELLRSSLTKINTFWAYNQQRHLTQLIWKYLHTKPTYKCLNLYINVIHKMCFLMVYIQAMKQEKAKRKRKERGKCSSQVFVFSNRWMKLSFMKTKTTAEVTV